jgi:diketogulonate reductase-like aldo/keto reductase
MEYREICGGCDKVSVVGMGTYYDAAWIVLSRLGIRRGAELKVQALRAGIRAGINFIDTAELYGSEPLVGRAIQGQRREDLFIATKVWPTHLRREALFKALRASLSRLGTNYVDLYQVHFPNPRVPIGETMGAMEEMVDKGLIRYIGVSNFSAPQLRAALQALKRHRLATVQMEYNLANRRIEADLIPLCKENGIGVIAYYPLGHGRLLRNEVVIKVAKEIGRTPAQVVLNWLIGRGAFPIPRASRPDHVVEDAEATGWEIPSEKREELERALERGA